MNRIRIKIETTFFSLSIVFTPVVLFVEIDDWKSQNHYRECYHTVLSSFYQWRYKQGICGKNIEYVKNQPFFTALFGT